jgi:uncharacterized protein (DUF1330 family)
VTVYVVAQISITDPEPYQRYQARFMDVLRRFGGRLLAYDQDPRVEEGRWEHERVVLLSFPDNDTLRSWADSADYREIAKDRRAGSTAVVLSVSGLA